MFLIISAAASFDNPMRDPRNKNNIVALRGALFMQNLHDEVLARGYKIVAIKTDSIKIANATKSIVDFCIDYAKQYGYKFDFEAYYDRICQINDADYIACKNSTLIFEGGTALTDNNGNFIFKNEVDYDGTSKKNLTFNLYKNEVHRVLVKYNGHDYIRDVSVGKDNITNLDMNLKLPYKTYGITPTGVTTSDSKGNIYNSVITLSANESYDISLHFNRIYEDSELPLNTVRCIIETDGKENTVDYPVDSTDTKLNLTLPLCELAKPGSKIYFQFLNTYICF